jgi:predicted secreted Zn-dependent protease
VGDSEWPSNVWRRSTASGGGNCAEVSVTSESVLMRNSQRPDGPVLEFTRAEWEAFLTGVRDGEFDI